MSAAITNRVYLPDGNKAYVSDDIYGDRRLVELHRDYGNLRIDACLKVLGVGLDELKAVWSGTIEEFFA